MGDAEPLIRNISDTALWAAAYRARESDRRDAVFRDPLARRLAGERGQQAIAAMPEAERTSWAWVARTYAFDQFIAQEIRHGADMVINLAAGLDARPYRMPLPPSLSWIEIDLPEILAYKQEILGNEKPNCALQQVALDLTDVKARRDMFDRFGSLASKILIITEGLLAYFAPPDVGALARDLGAPPSFRRWVLDIASPGLVKMLREKWGPHLDRGGVSFQFAPEEGPSFFESYGWKPLEVRSTLKTAARLGRLSFFFRLLAFLPESNGKQGKRPWSATCLFGRE
jgi:methyltransferase (TIGR00027 family)